MLVAVIVVSHAARTLVIQPVSMAVPWILLNYILWPPFILVIARNKEIVNRDLFMSEQQLKARNLELASQLSAANKRARLYEEPTEQEKKVVTSVLSTAAEEIADVEISFQLLQLQEHVASGAFGEVITAQFAGTTVAVKRLLLYVAISRRSRFEHLSVKW